ncbi:cold-shock protein [Rhodococcus sp. NPDC003994]
MVSTGVVREWHSADQWGVIDSDDTLGGAYAMSHAVRVEGVADLDRSPALGLRPGTEVDFEWSTSDEPINGMHYLVERVWPRGTTAPASEGAFHTSLWLSVDGPGPDGLTVMQEELDRDSAKSPPLEPPRFFTATGAVRTWHDEHGWGVLDSDVTPGGVWAHFSAIVGEGFLTLKPGQRVEFDYEPAIQYGFYFRAVTVRTL